MSQKSKYTIGTIVEVNGEKGIVIDNTTYNDYIGIKFKKFSILGHTCDGRCEEGYGYYCSTYNIIFICKPSLKSILENLK